MQWSLPKPLALARSFTQPCRSPSVKDVPVRLTVLVSRAGETFTVFGPYCAAYSETGTTACCAYATIWFMSAAGTTRSPPEVWNVTWAK